MADRAKEAKAILKALGMPPKQQNDNAAYTLLAFAAIGPGTPWSEAESVRQTPHGVIQFAATHGKEYAENTRETIRRQAIHQFVAGGILVKNPDDAALPTNSAKTHYALTPEALQAIRSFGSEDWPVRSAVFLKAVKGGLAAKFAKARDIHKVPVTLPSGEVLELSPGKHNALQALIVQEFLPRFAPGASLLYLGDTEHKGLRVEAGSLAALGIPMTEHDKLPDIVAFMEDKGWLFLVEAVTTHGPVSGKRHDEMERVLAKCKAGRVYVSAFLDFAEFKRHAGDIAWETEVWIAAAPDHLLHYNGDRFLGPR